MRSKSLILALFTFTFAFLGAFSTHAEVDNRYCVVKSATDDVDDFNSLRRKLVEGFNRTENRMCTEKITFDHGQNGGAYVINLGSGIDITSETVNAWPTPRLRCSILADKPVLSAITR